MTNNFQSLVGIAIALASLPATATAKTEPSSGVIIVSDVQAYPSEVVGNGEMRRPGEIDFSFRDGAAVAASEVRFEVRDGYGRYIKTIKVHGTFAPQVLIRKTVPNDSFAATVSITVLRATFKDGSIWNRESALVDHD